MAQARIDGSMKSRSSDEKITEERGVCVRSTAVTPSGFGQAVWTLSRLSPHPSALAEERGA